MAKEKKGVRLDHVSKIYQDPKTGKDFYAVHDANINIEPGEFVTLLGPSGCGKTRHRHGVPELRASPALQHL